MYFPPIASFIPSFWSSCQGHSVAAEVPFLRKHIYPALCFPCSLSAVFNFGSLFIHLVFQVGFTLGSGP